MKRPGRRSGNPAARPGEPRRCAYCPHQTLVPSGRLSEQTALRRFPHSPVLTRWAPLCAETAATLAAAEENDRD